MIAAVASAAVTAAILLVVLRPPGAAPEAPASVAAIDVASEAVGDHLRVLAARDLGVASNDFHNVKPWFAGKLDFTPPVTFLGDDDFPLRGGDVAVFLGHRAATFVYAHRLHVIPLFVFESDATPDAAAEDTLHGFHVITWRGAGFGYALVSDVAWDDLRALAARLGRSPPR